MESGIGPKGPSRRDRSRTRLLVVTATLLAVVSGCSTSAWDSLKPGARPYKELKPPGYFDIGAGYGVAFDTRDGPDNDASGFVASFKAYPFGRWYGELKDDVAARESDLSETGKTTLQRLANLLDRREEFVRSVAAQLSGPDIQEHEVTQLRLDVAAIVDRMTAPTRAQAVKLVDLAKPPLGSEEAATLRGRLLKQLTKYSDETATARRAFPHLGDLGDLERSDIDAIDRLAAFGKDEARNWILIQERAAIWNRLSVFYGISGGKFSGGGLDSVVNVVGVGFDVSPDLALMVGCAFYDVLDKSGTDADADNSLFFGISLNLYSFKRLLMASKDF